jgi:hypothetical protein
MRLLRSIAGGHAYATATCVIPEIMRAVGCKQAERLLWEYLEALGDSHRAQLDYVEAIRSGSIGSIKAKEKALKGMTDRVRAARRAFEQHAAEHKCCPTPVQIDSQQGRKAR